MTGKVVSPNEIELNSIKFPLTGDGQIHPVLTSRFAPKQVIGDYDKDSDPNRSSWVIAGDQQGGLLQEEMDETTGTNKFWWSSAYTPFKDHLANAEGYTSASIPTALTVVNADMELTTGWTGGARSSTQAHAGTYSWEVGATTAYQDLTWSTALRGTTVCWRVYVWQGAVGSAGKIGINDGISTTWSSSGTAASWVLYTVTMKLATNATRLRLQFDGTDGDGNSAYYDDSPAEIFPIGTPSREGMVNFNGNMYFAAGQTLYKQSGADFVRLFHAPATITALIAPLNSCLFLFLGDSEQYWYMNTSEVFTQTTNAAGLNAYYGCIWDGYLAKINSTGTYAYTATPNSATPTWTAGAVLEVPASSIQGIFQYRDVNGDDQVYCSTKDGLWVHDAVTPNWYLSQLKMTNHPNGGKAFIVWGDSAYISAGLHVYRYTINGDTVTIESVGLDKDDGLPVEMTGEIVKFIDGIDVMYALVDASQSTGVNHSGIYVYNDSMWRCFWTGLDYWNFQSTVTDTGNGWTNDSYAADRRLDRKATSNSVAASAWTEYLEVATIASPYVYSVRFWATPSVSGAFTSVDIDAYYSAAWNDVYTGAFTESCFVEKALASAQQATSVRIRFYNGSSAAATIDLYEVQFFCGLDGTALETGTISTVSSYRLFFSFRNTSTAAYSMILSRTGQSRTKTLTNWQQFGTHITSWFDAGWVTGTKNALALKMFGVVPASTGGGISVSYRIDHASAGSLVTGWTALGSYLLADSAAQKTFTFGSNLGVVFKAIQFKFDLWGNAVNLFSDITYAVLEYEKVLAPKWGWQFTVDCTQPYNNKTPEQLLDALITAAEVTTLIPLNYKATTKYVRLQDVQGEQLTGDKRRGTYTVLAVEK